MNDVRAGRALRLPRQRQGLTQAALARRVAVSQSTISLVERGHLDLLAMRCLRAIFATVGATYDGVVTWRGGELDRLLDARHAAIVERMAARLRTAGWDVVAEVTFNEYGDRGSMDLLAIHPSVAAAVVVEVKSELTAIEETVRRLDVKVRVAPGVARDRFGRRPRVVGPLLILPDTSSARGRVRAHAATFCATLPDRAMTV